MKIFRYLLMASVVFLTASCLKEEENIFEKQAAQRMNESVEKVFKILEGAENGWEVQFYPAHDGELGGVAMVMVFKDGVATIYNSEAGTEPGKCLYQVKGEQECLLTFDTYTEIFHYYSEPMGSDAPYGLESDYEFAFKSVSEDGNTLVFKGKRYGQPFVLKRMAKGVNHEDYINEINELYAEMFDLPRSVAVIDGKEYEVNFSDCVFSYKQLETVIEDDIEVEKSITYSFACAPTRTGVVFQSPVTFQGVTFQELTYNAETKSLANADETIAFPFVTPKGYRTYEELEGTYTFVDADGDTYNPVVKANGDGLTYTISGMTYSGLRYGNTVVATYNNKMGSLEIGPQYIGRYSSYYCWVLCTTPSGSATWSPTAKLQGRNDEEGNIIFDASGAYSGLIEYACSAQQISGDNILGYLTKYAEPLVFTRKK